MNPVRRSTLASTAVSHVAGARRDRVDGEQFREVLLYGRRYHTDRNTLTKIGEPTPNPIASECRTPDRDLEWPARRAARLTAYLGRVEGLTVYFFSVRVFTISAICRSDSASSALTSF